MAQRCGELIATLVRNDERVPEPLLEYMREIDEAIEQTHIKIEKVLTGGNGCPILANILVKIK